MKAWIGLCILGIACVSQAEESRSFERVAAERAVISVVVEDAQSVQAHDYVDGKENEKFLKMLLDDPQSRLTDLRKSLENENCEASDQRSDGWVEDCGGIELSSGAQTAFGRAGWFAAGAQYTYFVGFRHVGNGEFLNSTYIIVLHEDVQVEMPEGQVAGSAKVVKSLSLGRILRIPDQIRILPIK
ncbi:hypothetical protein [Bdellovibrio sp.]|uniref:hypothetical protein n=1 Tax=Bdellovibrio sp. TaxID=28201 RepID=UPI00322165F9